jgi:hypothetical protein
MPRPSHSSWLDHRIISGEQYRSLSSSLCNFLHSPVTAGKFFNSRFKPEASESTAVVYVPPDCALNKTQMYFRRSIEGVRFCASWILPKCLYQLIHWADIPVVHNCKRIVDYYYYY